MARKGKAIPPSQPTEGAAMGEEQGKAPAAAPATVSEEDQGTPSLFSDVGCKQLAYARYQNSVFPEDRKRVEDPSPKSVYEALVYAGRVSFLSPCLSLLSFLYLMIFLIHFALC